MKKLLINTLVSISLLLPTMAFAHGDEDHGSDYKIKVVHVMENGFHGKLEDKIIEVVLAPEAEIKKEDKLIAIKEVIVGNVAMVQGTKMPGNKIGATKIEIESISPENKAKNTEDHSNHDHSSH